jgi:lipoprotein NlpD
MKFQQRCFFLTTLFCIVLLAACSSSGKKWDPDDYTVKSGDTVYSIAWRYELDPEEFADWNNLGQSKLIKPGQRLHTRQPAGFKATAYETNSSRDIAYGSDTADNRKSIKDYSQLTKIRVSKGDTLYGISAKYGVSVNRLVQLNQLKKPYVIQPGQTIFLQPITTARNTSTKTTNTSKPVSSTRTQQPKVQTTGWSKTVRWQRPANGKIVKKFNRKRNDAKGIDIAGKQGDAIVAAADGKVVYSGNGLISYGNLVIIKHNKSYLSAYAYNRKLLVNEGDQVKSGQKIAEMGRKDTSSPRLHFEIRKNGKPVDPLKYLPW